MTLRRAIVVVFLLVGGCSSRDIVASSGGADGPAYCAGSGPPIIVGDVANPAGVCTGTVAVQTFTRALCTCEGYATSTPLATDSFDGSLGPYAAGTAGTVGGVGIDGALSASAMIQVGGSLVVAGTGGASFLVDPMIAHDLEVGGPLGTNVRITAGGNARVAGNTTVTSLAVAGTFTTPATATVSGTVTAGATVRAPVAIAAPCACGPTDLVDIAAFVGAYAAPATNNDAAIGLSPTRLTNYQGDVTLDLPCGIYHLGTVKGDGAITLRITGRVALLVDGDLALMDPLSIELATQDAELDLMISGLVSSPARIVAGDPAHPSRTRIYVGGSGTIELSGDSELAANVYAPNSAVALSAPSNIFGSLFVRRIDQAASLTIHYDEDVLRADVGCFL